MLLLSASAGVKMQVRVMVLRRAETATSASPVRPRAPPPPSFHLQRRFIFQPDRSLSLDRRPLPGRRMSQQRPGGRVAGAKGGGALEVGTLNITDLNLCATCTYFSFAKREKPRLTKVRLGEFPCSGMSTLHYYTEAFVALSHICYRVR